MAKIFRWECSQTHVNCFDQGFKCCYKSSFRLNNDNEAQRYEAHRMFSLHCYA